ncbi:MAG: serine/threonine protein kinase, partial [Acidobacteriota bacterium]|nr:serine/threonine protein kinase [Acidobacteriota bacterium]
MSDTLERFRSDLADRYAIERELGRGGMATVFLARDIKHHRKVAIKVLRPELTSSVGIERFSREIQIGANLTHPHVLTLIDSGEAGERLYYVMPFLEGESLRERLNRDRQLPTGDALRVAGEIADALGYAHGRGVLHRDVKPENIMLSGGHAVIVDFGIARMVDDVGAEGMTVTGMAIGTPYYMSPEQFGGESDIDGRSDIYSLGCVLYEMLTGEPPFKSGSILAMIRQHMTTPVPDVRALRPSVSDGICHV